MELTLADGTADVGWYELDVLKEAGGWKVVSFREGAPDLSGWSLVLGRAGDVEAAKEVFAGYLDDLATGRYKEADQWLAGPALKEHLAAGDVLSKGKLLEAVSEVSLTPLARDGKLLVARCDYRAGEKDVHLIAIFYQTVQGWRVVNLTDRKSVV